PRLSNLRNGCSTWERLLGPPAQTHRRTNRVLRSTGGPSACPGKAGHGDTVHYWYRRRGTSAGDIAVAHPHKPCTTVACRSEYPYHLRPNHPVQGFGRRR